MEAAVAMFWEVILVKIVNFVVQDESITRQREMRNFIEHSGRQEEIVSTLI